MLISAIRARPYTAFNVFLFAILGFWQVLLGFLGRGPMSGPEGQAIVVGVVLLFLVVVVTVAYAWASARSRWTVYAVTSQRLLSVAPEEHGGTSWMALRELKHMRIWPLNMVVFERALLPVEQVLLREPTFDSRDADYVREGIQRKVVFTGVRDPRALCDLVRRTADLLPRKATP